MYGIYYMNLYTFTNKNQPHVGKYTVPYMASMGHMYQTASQKNHSPGKTVCWESLSSQQDALENPRFKRQRFDINSSIPAMFVDFQPSVLCSDVWFFIFSKTKNSS